MTDAPKYLRARDIAQLTGVSLRTARRWISKEIFASAKVGGASCLHGFHPRVGTGAESDIL
jgi:hypothetical protein